MDEIKPVILTIAALVTASGIFFLFEEALKSVRKTHSHKKTGDVFIMAARVWAQTLRITAALLAGLSMERLTDPFTAAACAAAFVLVILIFGEFVPRLIARLAPDRITAAALPLLRVFSLPLRPVYAAARAVGNRLQPLPHTEQTGMTEDELHNALMEGEKSGIVESKELTMVEGVFYLGDRPLGAFMTHRSDIQWLDINDPAEEIRAKVMEFREQRCFPVADGTLDEIIGAAYPEDIILDLASGSPAGLRTVMKNALFAPETMPALKAFESFKRGEAYFLFVMEEYGGFAGMVSVLSLMEEIVGELAAPRKEETPVAKLDDGSWLVDGGLNIDDAAELLALPDLASAQGDYHTLAGFVLSIAGELPRAGDKYTYGGYCFTVLDMDGNRIDKIGIRKEKDNF